MPQKASIPQENLIHLEEKISGLAKEGETGLSGMEESGKAIMDLVDNNVQDADILAQVIGITSAGAK